MSQLIARYLAADAICLGVEAVTSREVIDLLGGRLATLGRVRDGFTHAVMAREAVMPTGLPLGGGFNVAVPHTDPEHVVEPALALATLVRPVGFGSMDDPQAVIPVGVVVMMALADKQTQIDLLQEVAAFIQRPGAVDMLAAAASPEEVYAALAA